MFRETVTGADGTFIVSGIVPGTYEVTAELQGFKKLGLQGHPSRGRQDRDASMCSSRSAAIEEVVNVTAESPLVDVTSKEIGGNITSDELVELPSVNGNFIGFIGLLPGIVPTISTESFGSDSISVNGQDPRNNNYMLDGGNNNDDVIGQRAGTQARTPIEAIQEFQVITNQFDARVRPHDRRGRQRGDQVGHQHLHGSAFGFFQDADLTAKDYFAKKNATCAKPDTQHQRWGGTVGGPIVKDKVHFFFSLERVHHRSGEHDHHPGAPGLEHHDDPGPRVEHDRPRRPPDQRQQHLERALAARDCRRSTTRSSRRRHHRRPASARKTTSTRRSSATFNSVLSQHQGQHAAPGWTRENVAFANPCFNGNGRDLTKCEPTLAFQTFTDQQDNTAQSRINDAIQFDDTFAWFIPDKHGDHDIKLGAQYEFVGADNLNQGNMNGTFAFGTSNGAVQRRRSTDLSRSPHDPRRRPVARSTRRRTTSRSSRRTSGG